MGIRSVGDRVVTIGRVLQVVDVVCDRVVSATLGDLILRGGHRDLAGLKRPAHVEVSLPGCETCRAFGSVALEVLSAGVTAMAADPRLLAADRAELRVATLTAELIVVANIGVTGAALWATRTLHFPARGTQVFCVPRPPPHRPHSTARIARTGKVDAVAINLAVLAFVLGKIDLGPLIAVRSPDTLPRVWLRQEVGITFGVDPGPPSGLPLACQRVPRRRTPRFQDVQTLPHESRHGSFTSVVMDVLPFRPRG